MYREVSDGLIKLAALDSLLSLQDPHHKPALLSTATTNRSTSTRVRELPTEGQRPSKDINTLQVLQKRHANLASTALISTKTRTSCIK